MKVRFIFCIFFVILFSNIQAQSPAKKFHLSISNAEGLPDNIDTLTNGRLNLHFKDATLNEIFSSFTIFEFGKEFPTARTPFLQTIYKIVTDDIGLMDTLIISGFNSLYPFIQEIEELIPAYAPNDFGLAGGAVTIDYAKELIRLPEAWNITKGDPGIVIGITDTYFEISHEDLGNQILRVYGANDPSVYQAYHGTQVAGCAGAATDNNVGITGSGFNCKLIVSSIKSYYEMLKLSQLGARVLNVSLAECSYDAAYQSVFDEIYSNGTVVVAAAGNGPSRGGCGSGHGLAYPASYNHVISVSSVGHLNNIGTPGSPASDWKDVHESTIGDPLSCHTHNIAVDIVAPGYNVLTTKPNNTYGGSWGTSYASPIVAGICGLILSVRPCLNPDEVEFILKSTAVNIDGISENAPYAGLLGAGRIDAFEAVKAASLLPPCQPAIFSKVTKTIPGTFVTDEMNGRVISWADYDNDGDLDIFMPVAHPSINNITMKNVLYQNNCNGDFTRITALPEGIVSDENGVSNYGVWGDVDNDDDLDLFVTNYGQNNFYYLNNGDGTFTANTTDIIANDGGKASIGGTWADFDNDGNLDLFVANDDLNLGGNPEKDGLYFGDGAGNFTKVPGGVIDTDIYRSISVAPYDFTGDGFLDLIVTGGSQVYVYENTHTTTPRTFSRNTTNAIATEFFSTGPNVRASWVDYDNDLDLDLYLTLSWNNPQNVLFRNNGGGVFTKITDINNPIVTDHSNSEGGDAWGDIDNDGDLDLVVATNSGTSNSLYFNNGNGTFFTKDHIEPISNEDPTLESKGPAFADYDHDGDLDLFISNLFGLPTANDFFYQNLGNSNHWINIKLEGTTSNRSAIGSLIKVRTGSQWQMRQVVSRGGSPLEVHFGFGATSIVNELIINWPSGLIQTFNNVTVDQFINIVEGGIISVRTLCTPDLPPASPSIISGNSKFDGNNNCTPNFNLPNKLTKATNTGTLKKFYTFSDANGSYQFRVPGGNYDIEPVIATNDLYNIKNCTPVAEVMYNQTVPPNSSNNNFFYTLNNPVCDVEITIAGIYQNPLGSPCPNILQQYCVNIKNNGLAIDNVSFTIEVDPSVIINALAGSSCFLSPNINGNIFTGTLPALISNQECQICLDVNVPASVPLGTAFTTTVSLDGDCNSAPASFFNTLNEVVTCAYDPNDKMLVLPDGCGPENSIAKNEELVYQIRFQNVGNAPAFNVLIRDELDENLDLSTFKVMGSSHNITDIQIIPDNTLIIKFDNILLPDEASDPQGSNGFVSFSINTKQNTPDGTIINNQAEIFFDLNEAVITNNVMNTLRDNPFPVADFRLEHPCNQLNNEFSFIYTGGTEDGATYLWEFGAGSSPSTSTSQNPTGVIFNSSGERQVTLTITRFGCMATITKTINIVNPIGCEGDQSKILVCHIPPGNSSNPHEICVSVSSIAAHLNHGDCIGSCMDPIVSVDLYREWDEKHLLHNLTNPFIGKKPKDTINSNKLTAFPNPSDGNVTIAYIIDQSTNVILSLYNIHNVEVLGLVDEYKEDGTYSININTSDFVNGVYFIVLKTDKNIDTYKLILVR